MVFSNQNLQLAWNKVRDNKGCAGGDGVTLEEFERNLNENLTQVQKEIEVGDYRPFPVLRIYIDKEDGKKRSIGIPSVRDRVVQQTLLLNMSPIFEKEFLDCSFAYRPGRSALNAIERIEGQIKKGNEWVLDGDIEKFFDSVDHDLLLKFVSEKISDEKVLNLVKQFLKAGVFENMMIHEEYCGITQGSVISPLLANVYLHKFDIEMTGKGYSIFRYADDFIVLENSKEKIDEALNDVVIALKALKLNLNETKTKFLTVKEGFVFLGYYIDACGKGPSKKAISAISQKLNEMSRSNISISSTHKIDDIKQSIRGWTGYFRYCRGIEPENEFVLIALIETSFEIGDKENAEKLYEKRKNIPINDPEIWYRLGYIAQKSGKDPEALDDFSRALALDPEHSKAKNAIIHLNLVDENKYDSIERLKRLIKFCPDLARPYQDMAFCYSELGEYGMAQESFKKAMMLEIKEKTEEKTKFLSSLSTKPQHLTYSDNDVSLFFSIFKGRESIFARQWIDEKGRRGFSPSNQPFSREVISKHLDGNETLGIYLLNEKNQVHLCVIDIDIDQKILLESSQSDDEFSKLHNLTHQDAVKVASICDGYDIPVLIEDSGFKGRHIWFFFENPINAKLAKTFLKFIIDKSGKPVDGIHREIFPNTDKLKENGYGPLIKLPLGIHRRTNRRCFFLDRTGNPFPEQLSLLSHIKKIGPRKVEEMLFTFASRPVAAPVKKEAVPLEESLISGCNVINYLVKKAKETHYLDNSERVTLLYSLGPLGQEGKDFLHKIISNCINYDYDYTEKRIKKMKPYPISCYRIREKHEDFALDVGCNCSFKIPKGGYPSPVLYAFKRRNEWLFQPSSSSGGKDDGSKFVPDDMDTLSLKLKNYIELKKQMGGVEKSIQRLEEEMSSLFDKGKTDSIATEYGLLERNKKAGNKVEWLIKL